MLAYSSSQVQKLGRELGDKWLNIFPISEWHTEGAENFKRECERAEKNASIWVLGGVGGEQGGGRGGGVAGGGRGRGLGGRRHHNHPRAARQEHHFVTNFGDTFYFFFWIQNIFLSLEYFSGFQNIVSSSKIFFLNLKSKIFFLWILTQSLVWRNHHVSKGRVEVKCRASAANGLYESETIVNVPVVSKSFSFFDTNTSNPVISDRFLLAVHFFLIIQRHF